VTIRYLLDTSIMSEPIKSRPNALVLDALAGHDGELATCSVVWHELQFGAERLPASAKRRAIESYLNEAVRTALPILPYDEEAAAWHARERARLERRGLPPAAADGQIAAIAHVNELTLVTGNPRDFRGFAGLRVEDWTRGR
jgi:tRNA(fMet)-specific endonuclease VapC